MTAQIPATGLQVFLTESDDGRLERSFQPVPVPQPDEDEVVIRIEATPINPSDLCLLLAGSDRAQVTIPGDVTFAAVPADGRRTQGDPDACWE